MNFNLEKIFISFCFLVFSLSIILSLNFYYSEQNKLMHKNIEHAIDKGIESLSIRCAYAKSDDRICISYAASKK